MDAPAHTHAGRRGRDVHPRGNARALRLRGRDRRGGARRPRARPAHPRSHAARLRGEGVRRCLDGVEILFHASGSSGIRLSSPLTRAVATSRDQPARAPQPRDEPRALRSCAARDRAEHAVDLSRCVSISGASAPPLGCRWCRRRSISIRTCMPGSRQRGGSITKPTPAGVPVAMIVPGSRVNAVDRMR